MVGTCVKLLWLLGAISHIYGQHSSNSALEKRVDILEKQSADQGIYISVLIHRLEHQEDTIKSHSQILVKQQKLLDRQERQLKTHSQMLKKQQLIIQQHDDGANKLKVIIRKQNEKINDQERVLRMMTIASRFGILPRGNDESDSRADTLNSVVSSEGTDVSSDKKVAVEEKLPINNSMKSKGSMDHDHSKRLALGEGPVAFHAVIDIGDVTNLGINQNIVFEVVVENLGGAYHNQHGLFVAPVDGVYIFSVSILSNLNSHPEFEANLNKDGVVLARVFGHGDNGRYDQGSVTVVSQLQQGSEVWVSLSGPFSGASIFGGRFSTFTGCLLYKL